MKYFKVELKCNSFCDSENWVILILFKYYTISSHLYQLMWNTYLVEFLFFHFK